MKSVNRFALTPVAHVRSELKRRKNAPRQGYLGAPEAWIEVLPKYQKCLYRVAVGDEVIVLTWLHEGKRDVMRVHPGNDKKNPLTGVFGTRSPDRPNPIGLHRVKILEMQGLRLRVTALEAIDGTPVVDIKPVLTNSCDS